MNMWLRILYLLLGISSGAMEFTCPQATGYFPNRANCRSYYVCSNYTHQEITCADSTFYHPAYELCDHRTNGNLCQQLAVERFQCPRPNGYFRDPSDCSVYYRCVQNYADRFICPTQQFFNPNYQICEDIALVKECYVNGTLKASMFLCPTENGYYRDPKDCRFYYRCMGGTATRYRCPTDKVFNMAYNICDDPSKVSDCTGSIPETNFRCPQLNGYFRHPDKCHVYYRCLMGVSKRLTCGHGKAFHHTYKTCMAVNSVPGCGNTVTSSSLPCAKGDGYYPDSVFCQIFYRCFRGLPIQFECAPGTFFDTTLGICNHPYQTPQCDANGRRYSSYMHALGSQALPNTETFLCPQSCGRFPHPRRCESFVVCSDAIATVHTCPSGLAYNAHLQVCDFPTNFQCYENVKIN